ncbi:MAG: hypothetical protein IJI22_02410 [Bacilli bacterium]|nr:hypothetical protein [Bacilli bacterium]
MIGIVNNPLESFIITEEIRKIYPKCNIYICNIEKINQAIEKLKAQGCKIIIVPANSIISKLRKIHKEIVLLPIPVINKKELFLLDNNDLINEVVKGNIKKIEKILKQIKIEKTKSILINDPKLLLIKEYLYSIFSNKIITSIDYLMIEIKKTIIEQKINCGNKKITITIY